jgi:hypothetical protein
MIGNANRSSKAGKPESKRPVGTENRTEPYSLSSLNSFVQSVRNKAMAVKTRVRAILDDSSDFIQTDTGGRSLLSWVS